MKNDYKISSLVLSNDFLKRKGAPLLYPPLLDISYTSPFVDLYMIPLIYGIVYVVSVLAVTESIKNKVTSTEVAFFVSLVSSIGTSGIFI